MAGQTTHVMIIGATGSVGRELTRLFTADGHQVHAVGRDRAALAELAAQSGAITYPADLAGTADLTETVDALREQPISLAIASIGGWYVAEPGLELPMATWTSTITSNLTAHFVAARTFAPLLTGEQPTYLALNGIASHYPCEGSVAISVAGAGQKMMLDVLASEGRDQPTTFAELVVDTPILMPGQEPEKDEPTHTIEQVYAAIAAVVSARREAGRVLRTHLG